MADARRQPLCEHCDVLDSVLKDLLGPHVASVIVTRVRRKLHGQDEENPSSTAKAKFVPHDATSVHPHSSVIQSG